MKKMIKHMLAMAFVLGLVLANTAVAKAANITAINAGATGNQISVSGTCDAGVIACAVLVYDSTGTTMVDMETCAASGGSYSYTLANTFADGNYVVKVADYDGGDYATANVTVGTAVTSSNPVTSTEASTATSPKTDENHLYSILMFIGLAATTLSVYLKRRYDKVRK